MENKITNTLYESLCKVLHKFKSSNFIGMNSNLMLGNVTSDDLKAFNDYFQLEPKRFVWGDWDILKFKKDDKDLTIEDYAEFKKQIDAEYDNLCCKTVVQSKKEKVKLKYEDYGWLSPNGEFYPSDWGTHQTKAQEIILNLGLLKDYVEVCESEPLTQADYLSKYKNFILLHSPSQGIPYPTILNGKRLTKKQKDFLYDFYTERNFFSLAHRYFNEE